MGSKTIQIVKEERCTGCGACFNCCPVGAIEMKYNSEGFIYPVVKNDICIACGRCQTVCPELKLKETISSLHANGDCFAVMAEDSIRAVSSSGGMFTLLADYVLEQDGVVCGAVYTDDYQRVEHIVIERNDDLSRLRGSKYIQSEIGSSYKKIKEAVSNGKLALFVGVPCQVAGLYTFLGERPHNLITADLICHGANSLTAYQSFIKEISNGKEIAEVNFRDKSIYGWSTPTTIRFKDGSIYNAAWNESKWYDGFLKGIINRLCCGTCHYAQLSRAGDFTLGDFWQIHRWKKEYNDWKGTSLVIVNTQQAKAIFNSIKSKMKLCVEADIHFAAQYNAQLVRPNKTHSGRRFFFKHLPKDGYHKSLWYGQKWRYDVGLVGWWFAANYGSVLTYYALGKVLEDMDLLAIMIRIPKVDGSEWEPVTENNIKFMEKYFPVSKSRPYDRLHECNRFCDMFMVGSDQLWVRDYVNLVGYTFMLDFVDSEHKKIAYATSLGYDRYRASENEKIIASAKLHRFDAISVRESSGISVCKKSFDIDVERQLDPVFLCNTVHYDALALASELQIPEQYLLCYILDYSDEKHQAVKFLENQLGLRAYIVVDMKTYDIQRAKWGKDENVLADVGIEDFIKLIKNCSFLLSDSHHGICFGLIYHKNFICIANSSRGYTRFVSLFDLLEIKEHMVDNVQDILHNRQLLEPINYSKVSDILAAEKERSMEWLAEALSSEKKKTLVYDILCLLLNENHMLKEKLAEHEN